MKKKLFIIRSKNISKGVEKFSNNLSLNFDLNDWEINYLYFKSFGFNLFDKNHKKYKLNKDDLNIFVAPAPAWLLNKSSIIIIYDLISLEFPIFKYLKIYMKPRIKYFVYFLSWKLYKYKLNFLCISKSTQNKLKGILDKKLKLKKYSINFGYISLKDLNLNFIDKFSEYRIDNVRKYRWMAFYDIQPHKNPEIISKLLNESTSKDIKFSLITKNKNIDGFKRLKEFKFKDQIFFRPNEKLLKNIYLNSQYLIYPSTVEGFGLPILEAINYGLVPCIYPSKVNIEVYGKKYKFYFDDFQELKKIIKSPPTEDDILYLMRLKKKLNQKIEQNSIFDLIDKSLN